MSLSAKAEERLIQISAIVLTVGVTVCVCLYFPQSRPAAKEDNPFKAILVKARQGDAVSQYHMGMLFYQSEKEEHKTVALEWFTQAAEQGYDSAQFFLGAMYALGEGTVKDKGKAVYWFSQSAEQGNETAKKYLDIYLQQ